MMSRYQAWLNNVEISDINPDILITDINYKTVERDYRIADFGRKHGSLAGKDFIKENGVQVSFMVRKYSTVERQAVIQDLIKWCYAGGWLETSDRPFQRMYVKCTKLPTIPSVMKWLDVISVEFTAYAFPFWQDKTPQKLTVASGGTGTAKNFSALEVEAEAVITATAALSSFTLTCGDTSFVFSGLSVSAGSTVVIDYTDAEHILEIKNGTTSLLHKRSAGSSDDLLLLPGENTVSFTASGDASCELRWKGVYI